MKTKHFRKWLIFLLLIGLLGGCGESQTGIAIRRKPIGHEIRRIAFSTGMETVADAIGLALTARGFEVIGRDETKEILQKFGIAETAITKPSNLASLKTENWDAFVFFSSFCGVICGQNDQLPDRISVRLVSMMDGSDILGVWWQNIFGDAVTPPTVKITRKPLKIIAQEVAKGIVAAIEKIRKL